jgi:hypothetical protein
VVLAGDVVVRDQFFDPRRAQFIDHGGDIARGHAQGGIVERAIDPQARPPVVKAIALKRPTTSTPYPTPPRRALAKQLSGSLPAIEFARFPRAPLIPVGGFVRKLRGEIYVTEFSDCALGEGYNLSI